MRSTVKWLFTIIMLLAISPSLQVKADSSFSDISDGFWAEKEINYLVSKGVIKGFEDGHFGPTENLTRIQIANMVQRDKRYSMKNPTDLRLKDIPKEHAYYPVVNAVIAQGIFSEIVKGDEFKPHEKVTRAQMASILAKAYDLKGISNKSFDDVAVSHWAYPYVQALILHNITTGVSANEFAPNDYINRAQFSVFMARALEDRFKPVTEPQISLEDAAEIIYTDAQGEILKNPTEQSIRWYGFKTEMSTLYMTERSFEKFSYMIGLADQVLGDIAPYFGVDKLPQNIPVFISFDEPMLKAATGEYFAHEKRIFIRGDYFSPYFEKNEENLIGVFAHEYAHAYQDVVMNLNEIRSRIDSDMMWLNEGMAAYINHQYLEYKNYPLKKDQMTMRYKYDKEVYTDMIKNTLKVTGITIDDIKKLPNDEKYRGSAPYESMIYYIEKEYGHDKLFQFIEDYRTKSLSDSLLENFGVSEEEIISGWKEYFLL